MRRGSFICSPMLTHLLKNGQTPMPAGNELPLRAELFSADQMRQHGKLLADDHQVAAGRLRDRLLSRPVDIQYLFQKVAHFAFEHEFSTQKDYRVTAETFINIMPSVRPSLSAEVIEEFERIVSAIHESEP